MSSLFLTLLEALLAWGAHAPRVLFSAPPPKSLPGMRRPFRQMRSAGAPTAAREARALPKPRVWLNDLEKRCASSWIAAGAALALLSLPSGIRAADAPWTVKGAAFRFALRVKNAPDNPDAGTEIAVPDLDAAGVSGTDYTLTDAAGQPLPVAVVWRGEGRDALLLARDVKPGQEYFLYAGAHGQDWTPRTSLLLETRALPPGRAAFTTAGALQQAWTSAPSLGAKFVDTIFASDNPFGEATNFLAHYVGFLLPPEGDVQYCTNSSDASFVLANGSIFVDLPGNHPAVGDLKQLHPKRLPGNAAAGPVRIDYYAAKEATEGPAFMTMCRVRNGRAEQIPASAWLHPGTSEVLRAENAAGQPVPLPEIALKSYFGVGGGYLYEVHGELPASEPQSASAEWRFSDGGVSTGPSFKRIMAGTPADQRVTVQLGAVRVARRLNFGGSPPEDAGEGAAGRKRYLGLLSKQDPAHYDASMLRAVLPFLMEHGLDEQITPYASAWLRLRPPVTDPGWLAAETARLRAMAVGDPAAALAALREDTEGRARYTRQLTIFEIELLVFYQHDLASVGRVQQMAFGLGDTPEGKLAVIRLGDLYRLNGDVAQATLKYEAAQPPDPSNGRQLPAEDQANSITVASLIDQGDRQEAADKLTAWELAHPMAKLTTDFLLLRSRNLALYGRWREALSELTAFAPTHPDSPYQIDVDFQRARALYELGRKDEARKIWLDLARNYPKSDLAAASKKWAAKP